MVSAGHRSTADGADQGDPEVSSSELCPVETAQPATAARPAPAKACPTPNDRRLRVQRVTEVSHPDTSFDASDVQLEPKAARLLCADDMFAGGLKGRVGGQPVQAGEGAGDARHVGCHDQRSVRRAPARNHAIHPAVVVTSGTPLASASSTTYEHAS